MFGSFVLKRPSYFLLSMFMFVSLFTDKMLISHITHNYVNGLHPLPPDIH